MAVMPQTDDLELKKLVYLYCQVGGLLVLQGTGNEGLPAGGTGGMGTLAALINAPSPLPFRTTPRHSRTWPSWPSTLLSRTLRCEISVSFSKCTQLLGFSSLIIPLAFEGISIRGRWPSPQFQILSILASPPTALCPSLLQDPNPLIRALAVRTMGCIRVDKITEYLCDPLQRCLKVWGRGS